MIKKNGLCLEHCELCGCTWSITMCAFFFFRKYASSLLSSYTGLLAMNLEIQRIDLLTFSIFLCILLLLDVCKMQRTFNSRQCCSVQRIISASKTVKAQLLAGKKVGYLSAM